MKNQGLGILTAKKPTRGSGPIRSPRSNVEQPHVVWIHLQKHTSAVPSGGSSGGSTGNETWKPHLPIHLGTNSYEHLGWWCLKSRKWLIDIHWHHLAVGQKPVPVLKIDNDLHAIKQWDEHMRFWSTKNDLSITSRRRRLSIFTIHS